MDSCKQEAVFVQPWLGKTCRVLSKLLLQPAIESAGMTLMKCHTPGVQLGRHILKIAHLADGLPWIAAEMELEQAMRTPKITGNAACPSYCNSTCWVPGAKRPAGTADAPAPRLAPQLASVHAQVAACPGMAFQTSALVGSPA